MYLREQCSSVRKSTALLGSEVCPEILFFSPSKNAKLALQKRQKMHIKDVWFLYFLDIGPNSPQHEF